MILSWPVLTVFISGLLSKFFAFLISFYPYNCLCGDFFYYPELTGEKADY